MKLIVRDQNGDGKNEVEFLLDGEKDKMILAVLGSSPVFMKIGEDETSIVLQGENEGGTMNEEILQRIEALEKPRVFKNLVPQIVGQKENGDNIYEVYVKMNQFENGMIAKEVYAPSIDVTNLDIVTASTGVYKRFSAVLSVMYNNSNFSGISGWYEIEGLGTAAIRKWTFQDEVVNEGGFYIAQGDIEESTVAGSQLVIEEYSIEGKIITPEEPVVLEIPEIEDKTKNVTLKKDLFLELMGEQISNLSTDGEWNIMHWGQIKSPEDEVFIRFQGKPIQEEV
ncbi:hypothetical protein UJ101_02489 [Flavobacteriaceae bacterium UJ101]|nr:hypothetical protein UJ101_02489 [Flavobacteriaceae bacterium UJ101]